MHAEADAHFFFLARVAYVMDINLRQLAHKTGRQASKGVCTSYADVCGRMLTCADEC
jgi:hypothetical protein